MTSTVYFIVLKKRTSTLMREMINISCHCGGICTGSICSLGVRTDVKLVDKGSTGGGITKTRRIRENVDKRRLETLERLAGDQLAQIDSQLKQFSAKKKEFNSLAGKGGRRDKYVADLHREAQALYISLLNLYREYERDRAAQRIEVRTQFESVSNRYEKAKAKVIKMTKESEAQAKESLRIVKRWNTLRREMKVPAERKNAIALSDREIAFLSEQAILYNSLSTDAEINRDVSNEVKRLLTEYTKRKAKLKAEKKLYSNQLQELNKEIPRILNVISVFIFRNKHFLQPLDEAAIQAQLLEQRRRGRGQDDEQNLMGMNDETSQVDVDADYDSVLSETEESQSLVQRMDIIKEKLTVGEFTALREEFNTQSESFYLEQLIRMYHLKQRLVIESESIMLIALLIDPKSDIIATLYSKMIAGASKEELLTYIESVQLPVVIADIDKKLERLIRRETVLNKIKLLVAITHFINDEEDDSEQDENLIDVLEPLEIIRCPTTTATTTTTGDSPSMVAEQEIVIDTSESAIITTEEEVEGSFKAQVLFAPYEITDANPGADYEGILNGCVYRGVERETRLPVMIHIAYVSDNSTTEREVTQLLTEIAGFVKLVELFELPHFPVCLLTPCTNIKQVYTPVDVYIFEDLPLALSDVMSLLTVNDKFCILFEIEGLSSSPEERRKNIGNALIYQALRFISDIRMSRLYPVTHIVSQAASYITKRLLTTSFEFRYHGSDRFLNEHFLETIDDKARADFVRAIKEIISYYKFLFDNNKVSVMKSWLTTTTETQHKVEVLSMFRNVIRLYQLYFLLLRSATQSRNLEWRSRETLEQFISLFREIILVFPESIKRSTYSSLRNYFNDNLENSISIIERNLDLINIKNAIYPDQGKVNKLGVYRNYGFLQKEKPNTVKVILREGYELLYQALPNLISLNTLLKIPTDLVSPALRLLQEIIMTDLLRAYNYEIPAEKLGEILEAIILIQKTGQISEMNEDLIKVQNEVRDKDVSIHKNEEFNRLFTNEIYNIDEKESSGFDSYVSLKKVKDKWVKITDTILSKIDPTRPPPDKTLIIISDDSEEVNVDDQRELEIDGDREDQPPSLELLPLPKNTVEMTKEIKALKDLLWLGGAVDLITYKGHEYTRTALGEHLNRLNRLLIQKYDEDMMVDEPQQLERNLDYTIEEFIEDDLLEDIPFSILSI